MQRCREEKARKRARKTKENIASRARRAAKQSRPYTPRKLTAIAETAAKAFANAKSASAEVRCAFVKASDADLKASVAASEASEAKGRCVILEESQAHLEGRVASLESFFEK